MKPVKNNVFCPQCRRTKIQFSTEKEAMLFLQYNAEIIREENGYAPVRCYYCDVCKCWHLTSKEENTHLFKAKHHLPRYDREFEKTAKAAIRCTLREVKELLHKVNRFVMSGREDSLSNTFMHYHALFHEAISLFESITNDITKEQYYNINHRICIIKPYFL
ncbi:MAG: hypothetical protein MJZ15_00650 [Bacteroidales bacterium]|nr:hypothetical protein [Bacteroidales bacterium]